MSLKTCPECGLRKDTPYTLDGLCVQCHQKHQEEEDHRDFINISMPNGIIARWTTTPSFLDKKKNFRYFRIPVEQNPYFDSDKQYEIVVMEAKVG